MTTEQTASQLELAAQILRTGHPWEYQPDHHNWKKSEGFDPVYALSQRWPIRLALAAPPDNRPLHNPDNLTAEQVGAGWRLLVAGEKQTHGYQYWASKKWFSGNVFDEVVDKCNRDTTCRAPLSIPWPEAPKPDPYAELKAAHAEGKEIECLLGKRIEAVFGDLMEQHAFIFDEASTVVTSSAKGNPPYNANHVRETIRRVQPDAIIAFGTSSRRAIEDVRKAKRDKLDLPPVIECVHPAIQKPGWMQQMLDAKKQIKELGKQLQLV